MHRLTRLNTATLLFPNLISRSPSRRGFPVIWLALALALFALSPAARAADGDLGAANTAEGDGALASLSGGTANTSIGFDSLFSNTIGFGNTADGAFALQSNTIGDFNTAYGYEALLNNSTGNFNTATGSFTLYSNTTGKNNTATGLGALGRNTTASGNTATGFDALFYNTTGSANTAAGHKALQSNAIGGNNTANRFNALINNTSGDGNTAEGFQALNRNTTGGNNIALGNLAGHNLTTGSSNIDIGNAGVVAEANTIRIGIDRTQSATYVAGISGVTVAGGIGVIIDTNGHLGTVTSSARFKEAIKPMDKTSEAILALKPVTFRYKHELDPDAIPQFGLVAEQVEEISPDLVARDEEGKAYTVRYEAVNAMLLNEFLKEHRTVQELKGTVAQQQKQIEALTSTVQKVSDQFALSQPAPQLVANP
jgi:endosialidase-like protein